MSNDEEMNITLGIRVNKSLRDKLEKVQEDYKKSGGIEPTLSDVVRMLIEKGLEEMPKTAANGKRR